MNQDGLPLENMTYASTDRDDGVGFLSKKLSALDLASFEYKTPSKSKHKTKELAELNQVQKL